jgi:hypothetical protein
VPALDPAGLAFVRATRCTFGDDPEIFLTYAPASGERFSLYIADRGAREFKLLRHQAGDGVPQARHAVALAAGARHPATRVEVLMWLRGGLLFTWVGPAGTSYEAARGVLQAAP